MKFRELIFAVALLAIAHSGPALASPAAAVYVHQQYDNGTGDAGSGTVIANDGKRSLVLTSAHVVEAGRGRMTVLRGRTTYAASLVYASPVVNLSPHRIRVDGPDLALLLVEGNLPAASIASTSPAIGERVRLYGYGSVANATDGPAEKIGRVVEGPAYVDPVLSSTLGTISGDSGAGVFNDAGELVGVHKGRTSTAYAIPVGVVRSFVRERGAGLFPRLAARLAERRSTRFLAIPIPAGDPPKAPTPTKVDPKPPAVAPPAAPLGSATSSIRVVERPRLFRRSVVWTIETVKPAGNTSGVEIKQPASNSGLIYTCNGASCSVPAGRVGIFRRK